MIDDSDRGAEAGAPAYKCGCAALIGPPNAGKSTLLNALIGQKVSIVTPKPQTTRNRISGILTRDDCQIVFLDTPGILDRRGAMHKMMQEEAWQSLEQTDLILTVFDADMSIRRPDLLAADLQLLGPAVRAGGKPVLAALNKIDLFHNKHPLLPVLEQVAGVWPEAQLFPLSAKTGDGLDGLLAAVVAAMPEGPPMYPEDQISTAPMRFLAAEIIREKLFLALRQELPYSVAVGIEQWLEPGADAEAGTETRLIQARKGALYIGAVIYVSRRSHKGMIIGRHGSLLKEIGTASRKEIERMTGEKVFLELWVKVREDWTEDRVFLRSLSAVSQDGLEIL